MQTDGTRNLPFWIVFDAVGTLIYPDPPAAAAYAHVGRAAGSRLSLAEVERRFADALRRSFRSEVPPPREWERFDRLTTDEPREIARWRQIVAAVLDDVADVEACFGALFSHFAKPSSWKCYADVPENLMRLRQAGYRLGIASNFDSRLQSILAGHPELEPIELCFVSTDAGFRKPSARFFHSLAAAAGCRPEEILMVGDDPRDDVAGAKSAGLSAVCIDRHSPHSEPEAIADLAGLVSMLANPRSDSVPP